jgi:hypothetical protein
VSPRPSRPPGLEAQLEDLLAVVRREEARWRLAGQAERRPEVARPEAAGPGAAGRGPLNWFLDVMAAMVGLLYPAPGAHPSFPEHRGP